MVRRPRVVAGIGQALTGSSCWLAAPAGYGKTTAAGEYLQSTDAPHLWYRVDQGDQDIASFFHDLTLALPDAKRGPLPVFGPEYAEQPQAFARRFFRAFFASLPASAVLVLDDLHQADVPAFREALAILLRELPGGVGCICLSRTLPSPEFDPFLMAGQITVVGQDLLQFSEAEGRALVEARRTSEQGPASIARARGWAAGLVLLADQGMARTLSISVETDEAAGGDEEALFDVLGRQVFESLPSSEQDMLLKLCLLPDITPQLAAAMVGSNDAGALIERLHRRQLLVTRGERSDGFRLHDLLRDFLTRRLTRRFSEADRATLEIRAAEALERSGRLAEAIDLALQSRSWSLARRMMIDHAETVLAQGRRATFLDWCSRFPDETSDAWLCYWRGVAHLPDDGAAEVWLARAWSLFEQDGCLRGQHLSVARAVLVKTDSWRTHSGLSTWTGRALRLLEQPRPDLPPNDDLLVLIGLLRALDFAEDRRGAAPAAAALARQMVRRLVDRSAADPANLLLLASSTIIEHAGTTGQADLFEQAVDAVSQDLGDETVSPWVLGLWLVAFGSVSGRYFPFARRGFPYATADEALRSAIALGEREGLPGVEFGALYHLQYQMKLQNDVGELSSLIDRLGQVADSRHTTQVAVLADCQAAMHTMCGDVAEAEAACRRFMSAIEAANEPPIERWPHFITRFQTQLAARAPVEAASGLVDVLDLFDGAVRERTEVCIGLAAAFEAKWTLSETYPARLETAVRAIRAAGWTAVLANLPDLLSELLADALERGVETDFCRRLVRRRRLSPPPRRPQSWPWALKVHVLGVFRLERDGEAIDLGAKPAARSLELLRALAVAKDHTCGLAGLYDWLWPDADGDLAKAACEQALHRLRKLLGRSDLVVQREGKLRLLTDQVWVDLDHWEGRLHEALGAGEQGAATEDIFMALPGSLLAHERASPWSATAAARLRGKVLEVAVRLAERYEREGDVRRARVVHLRALDLYPDAARIHEALIRGRIARHDLVGAWEDYARFEKAQPDDFDEAASPALRALLTRTRDAGDVDNRFV